MDAKNIPFELVKQNKKYFPNLLLETSKMVSSDTIQKIIHGYDSKVKDYFGYRQWKSEYENVISMTFDFNPLSDHKNLEYMDGFFDYYYNFSKTCLLVPNVVATKNLYKNVKNGKRKKIGEELVLKSDQYLEYIDEAYSILNHKNHRGIFVPISLRYNIDEIKQITKHHLENEHFLFWVDYEGASSADSAKLSKIRAMHRMLEKQERHNEVILYSTNMRREITSNTKKNESPSSDVLTTIGGANIVGVNREPPRGGYVSGEKDKEILRSHKSRVLDPKSYYYIKKEVNGSVSASQVLHDNILLNTKVLYSEYKNQANAFLEEFSIKDYICKKRMIQEYNGGNLQDSLFQKSQTDIVDDFIVPL